MRYGKKISRRETRREPRAEATASHCRCKRPFFICSKSVTCAAQMTGPLREAACETVAKAATLARRLTGAREREEWGTRTASKDAAECWSRRQLFLFTRLLPNVLPGTVKSCDAPDILCA